MLMLTSGVIHAGIGNATDASNSALFVDAAWLKDNGSSVVVVDARSEKDFRKGHIPGAISAPWQPFTRQDGKPGTPGWGTLLSSEELATKIEEMGIDGSKPLVVYADFPGWGEDGRFAWMAITMGLIDIKILDGGFSAWKRVGGEVTKETSSMPVGKPINSHWNQDAIATTGWIHTRLGQITIVDTRAKKEFAGATPYGEARGGHLPGAISIPFETMFNPDGTMKGSQELQQLFLDAGLKPEAEIVTYCTAGIRSAHMTLVLQMVGFEKARNYDASFYEWAAMKQLPLE